MGNPTFFTNATTVAARAAEVPDASFTNGMNNGSCANPLGINAGGGTIGGTPEQFTLLDQAGAARTPQTAQYIGGDGLDDGVTGGGVAVRIATTGTAGDGVVTPTGNATLASLAAGWVPV